MAFVDTFVARWKEDRQQMREQVEWLESGMGPLGQGHPRVRGDTTAAQIEFYKTIIAKLDDLIARYSEAK